jgi:type II secretory pathway pseudopilin PulG
MIEALVSVALVGVAITSIMGAFGKFAHTQTVANQTEQMQRLAVEKYDELIGTGSLQTQSLNGDFSDWGNDLYVWDATVDTTGTENLSALTVTVQPRDNPSEQNRAAVNGLVYIQPQTTAPVDGGGQ